MTLRECYEMMCGDYEGVTGRLVSESLVRKFALKFLNDPSFGQLQAAIESGDGAEAFRAAFYGAQRSPFCFRTAAFRSQRPPIF